MEKVCVIGSMNMDLVIKTKNLPKKGETILAEELTTIPGGKGANQAVAASRLGCTVNMIASVGNDGYGHILTNALKKDKVITENILVCNDKPTGTAIINVDNNGDNTICVVGGANMSIKCERIAELKEIIQESDVVITQFETPLDSSIEGFKFAKEKNKITILNPAPAREIPKEILRYTDIIVPNETEAFELTGIEVNDLHSAEIAAKAFLENGVKFVVITLGSKGAAIISKDKTELIPAYKVQAIDSTAAGDSFIGALGKSLSNASDLNFDCLKSAVSFGNKVSSITVTREGAQSSIPTLKEVKEKYGEK
ncbi:ribokinase [Hathewaya limosa]|uniref:Ribokinase n=1 Tax=Hathewaya limosa TaxID=1536 RepID=A0ABU0JRJ2_HATLI|nr:ribokinase [Hathewaya limosa]MDQ0479698.1 ribokinase [Hathewaya limosa]